MISIRLTNYEDMNDWNNMTLQQRHPLFTPFYIYTKPPTCSKSKPLKSLLLYWNMPSLLISLTKHTSILRQLIRVELFWKK